MEYCIGAPKIRCAQDTEDWVCQASSIVISADWQYDRSKRSVGSLVVASPTQSRLHRNNDPVAVAFVAGVE
jgi:hypothetical protein